MVRRQLFIALLLLCLGLIPACRPGTNAFVGQRSCWQAVNPLAVIPFESLSGQPNAGMILADQLGIELERCGRIPLISPEFVRQTLQPLEGEALTPQRLGKLLGARTILTGSITEYRYKRGVGEQPVIGLSVRMVDCDSGDVLWAANASRTGYYSWAIDDSLSRLGQEIAADLAARIAAEAWYIDPAIPIPTTEMKTAKTTTDAGKTENKDPKPKQGTADDTAAAAGTAETADSDKITDAMNPEKSGEVTTEQTASEELELPAPAEDKEPSTEDDQKLDTAAEDVLRTIKGNELLADVLDLDTILLDNEVRDAEDTNDDERQQQSTAEDIEDTTDIKDDEVDSPY